MTAPSKPSKGSGLTVAVTGPTGSIGYAFLHALERSTAVTRVVGMARRPFDPRAEGLTKVEYRQGDVLDRASVDELVRAVDVVVHLAFLIMGSPSKTQKVNLEGSANVFDAAFAANVQRLVYTSSVAAYGFHEDNPLPLTEETPARGSEHHYYSAQKAELEELLARKGRAGNVDVYVFRPCIVAGPTALELVEWIPHLKLAGRLAIQRGPVRLSPLRVLPDPGTRFQLVHEDDVASALVAAVEGRGRPGAYNLAADGEVTTRDLAGALGWRTVPMPKLAVGAAVRAARMVPGAPPILAWAESLRVPVIMDTSKARRELGWHPRYDASATMRVTMDAARAKGLL